MNQQRVYVNGEDDTAVLQCPHCGTAIMRYVGTFKGGTRSAKVKCTCRMVYRVSFEFRRTHRKVTNLQGYYAKLPAANVQGMMLVKDISVRGIGFQTHNMHGLSKGDVLRVSFNLDDRLHSTIVEDAIVRWADNGHVGCEFMRPVGYDET